MNAGNLAMTVGDASAIEIQVLPAIRNNSGGVRIAEPGSTGWSHLVRADNSARRLAEVDDANNGRVVKEVIKLANAVANCHISLPSRKLKWVNDHHRCNFYLTPCRLTRLRATPYHQTAAPFREVANMTADPETLELISGVVRAQLPKYLSEEVVVYDVVAQNRPGPDDEDYVHVRVVLEDDPKLDPRKLNRFSSDMRDLLERSGIDHSPNISYANRSELGL